MKYREMAIVVLFGCVYFAAAELGHALSFPGEFASIWPPSGLFLAALLLAPRNRWQFLIFAALVGNAVSDVVFHGKTLPVAIGFWLANTAEAIVGALVLQRVLGSPFAITRLKHAVRFIFAALASGTLVGATVGAGVVSAAFNVPYGDAWRVWWFSGVMGILLVAPPVTNLIVCKPWREPGLKFRAAEASIVISGLTALSVYVFRFNSEPLVYTALPFLMWASIRLRICGATLSTIVLAGITVWNTANGFGPFVQDFPVVHQVVLTQGYLAVAIVISLTLASMTMEQGESRRQLEQLATLDSLTGLHNRRSFDTRLDEEISRFQRTERPLSLLIIDVDHFKQFNDQFGHPAGDAALQRVARLLEKTARATDFVVRIGGEEFAVLMPETDESNAVIAGERFREAIRDAVWPHRQITVSIGAATRSADIPHEASLVMQADMALYRSKKSGRDCVTHSDAAREIVEETVPVVSSWELVGHA